MTEPEQITAIPKEEAPVKVKDPRKVAAGKALAARNKAAREVQKKLIGMENSGSGLTLNNVMQVAAVVGAGFTLYHGYQAVKPYLGPTRGRRDTRESFERPVETVYKKPIPHKSPEKSPVKNDKKEFDME